MWRLRMTFQIWQKWIRLKLVFEFAISVLIKLCATVQALVSHIEQFSDSALASSSLPFAKWSQRIEWCLACVHINKNYFPITCRCCSLARSPLFNSLSRLNALPSRLTSAHKYICFESVKLNGCNRITRKHIGGTDTYTPAHRNICTNLLTK